MPISRCKHDYSAIRLLLNLTKINVRFEFANLSFFYDILNGSIDCSMLLAEISLHAPAKELRNKMLLKTTDHRANYGPNTVIPRLCKNANLFSNSIDFFYISQLSFRPTLRSVLSLMDNSAALILLFFTVL